MTRTRLPSDSAWRQHPCFGRCHQSTHSVKINRTFGCFCRPVRPQSSCEPQSLEKSVEKGGSCICCFMQMSPVYFPVFPPLHLVCLSWTCWCFRGRNSLQAFCCIRAAMLYINRKLFLFILRLLRILLCPPERTFSFDPHTNLPTVSWLTFLFNF